MTVLERSGSVVVDATPEQLYDLVSDVTRMGTWSPICQACWWADGGGPTVGSWFHGRNEVPGRTWETRSQVVAAEPGREFAWIVGGDLVHWSYTFEAVDGGTRMTESWRVLPGALTMFRDKYGERAQDELENRSEAARTGIPETLAAIKATAEAR